VGGDLTYRALQITINADVERPEERVFQFDPVDRARKEHPKLVTAVLTALRAYIEAGKPWGLKRGALGGFVKWDELVCGCLAWLGYADPLQTRQDVVEEDPERAEYIALLQTWYAEFGSRQVTEIESKNGPTFHLLLHKGEWDTRVVGWRFGKMQDRVESGLKLIRGTNKQAWQVVPVGKAPGEDKLPF
jgi:hypothetical protein